MDRGPHVGAGDLNGVGEVAVGAAAAASAGRGGHLEGGISATTAPAPMSDTADACLAVPAYRLGTWTRRADTVRR